MKRKGLSISAFKVDTAWGNKDLTLYFIVLLLSCVYIPLKNNVYQNTH